MIFLDVFLPVVFYLLAIALLVVLIILALKFIRILDKCEKVLDDFEEKVNSFNNIFNVINKTSFGISLLNEKVINSVIGVISKIFNRKKEKEEEDYYG